LLELTILELQEILTILLIGKEWTSSRTEAFTSNLYRPSTWSPKQIIF